MREVCARRRPDRRGPRPPGAGPAGSGEKVRAAGAGRGFTSAENRRYLRKGGNRYIIGERLRSGSAEAAAALSRQGRYQEVAGNLRVKEVRIAEDERFVICHDPEAAERDAAVRARMIARLKELTGGTDTLSKDKRAELRGVISTGPGLNRYLRVTPGGLLRIDAGKAKAEENLDGKYLLRTSDPKMSAENTCGATWPDLRRQLDRIAVGTFTGPAGTFRQRTEISPAQQDILAQLGIDPPPRICQLTPAVSR